MFVQEQCILGDHLIQFYAGDLSSVGSEVAMTPLAVRLFWVGSPLYRFDYDIHAPPRIWVCIRMYVILYVRP